jgi:hypothetical protein
MQPELYKADLCGRYNSKTLARSGLWLTPGSSSNLTSEPSSRAATLCSPKRSRPNSTLLYSQKNTRSLPGSSLTIYPCRNWSHLVHRVANFHVSRDIRRASSSSYFIRLNKHGINIKPGVSSFFNCNYRRKHCLRTERNIPTITRGANIAQIEDVQSTYLTSSSCKYNKKAPQALITQEEI